MSTEHEICVYIYILRWKIMQQNIKTDYPWMVGLEA